MYRMDTFLKDLFHTLPVYRCMLSLHQFAMRAGLSEPFFQASAFLNRKFGLPALQPVRVRK